MTDITKFNRNGAIRNIGDAKSRANFSDSFTTTISYSTGDLVIYDGSLYKFLQNHEAGNWNLNEVQQTNIKNEYLPLTGGILSGILTIETNGNNGFYIKQNNINLGTTTESDLWLGGYCIDDKNNNRIAYFSSYIYENGNTFARLLSRTVSGTTNINNYLQLNTNIDGTKSITVSDPEAWKKALNIYEDFNLTGTIPITGSVTLTDSRINSDHWTVEDVITENAHYLIGKINFTVNPTNNTVTIRVTQAYTPTNITVLMHYIQ